MASIISLVISSIVPMMLFMHLISYNPYFIHNHIDSINDINTMYGDIVSIDDISVIIDGDGI